MIQKRLFRPPKQRLPFGAAEFKVVCKPDRVQLFIHGDCLVAESGTDVYDNLLDYCVRQLGGRIDKEAGDPVAHRLRKPIVPW